MGRPLKIQKYGTMQGIFYNNDSQGTTAAAVAIDQAYPPFAAPTALDTPTVVLPQPVTSPVPFTGVVGGWYRNAFDTSDKMYQTRWSTSLIYHATKADSVQLQFAQSEGDSSLNQWRLSYKHSF